MNYLVYNNFLDPVTLEFVTAECLKRRDRLHYDGYDGHKRWRDNLDPRGASTGSIEPSSILSTIWNNKFWPCAEEDMLESKDSALRHAAIVKRGQVLLSSYMNGGFYGNHIDIDLDCIATAVLFICKEPQKFQGGDFILENELIPFKNNKLIVFASCRKHSVTEVVLKDNEFENSRFSIQYFMSPRPNLGKFPDESSNK